MVGSRATGVGDFLAVPLPHGGFGYARSLDPLLAFYRYKSADVASIHEVRISPVAFIAGVHVSWRKRWNKIGTQPLEESLQKPVSFFKSDVLTGRLSIYTRFPGNRNLEEERAATVPECQGLDPLGSWNPEQVENWLELILDGHEYPMIENMRARLSTAH